MNNQLTDLQKCQPEASYDLTENKWRVSAFTWVSGWVHIGSYPTKREAKLAARPFSQHRIYPIL